MSDQINPSTPKKISDEIDFMILAGKLWDGRKTIIKCVIGGAVLGLIIAFNSPKQFTVMTTMLPQTESESSMGGLSSLASIAGFDVDLGDNGSDISPVVYPQIVESMPFLLDLMNSKFTFSEVNKPVSLFDFYTKYDKPGFFGTIRNYTIGLPGIIMMALKDKNKETGAPTSDGLIHLSEEQDIIGSSIKGNVKLALNKKEGYLTLTCTFPEALLAAQVAARSQELLKKTITEYKTKRATEQLLFIEQRFAEKKRDFEKAQGKLAIYQDRNQFVNSAVAGTEKDRLQGEYQIAYSVYSELSKQLENAKIKVKKQTPVFVILKPVVVPLEKTAPKRGMIVVVWLFLGFVAGVLLVVGKLYLSTTKNKL